MYKKGLGMYRGYWPWRWGHVPVNISVFKLAYARVRARVCLRVVNALQPARVWA